ncbi:MAG TPA: RdgB/HAM1 family non-canonical purine NTP pyrophosphatase [Chitinophagaceae bacterium]|nr:RdgB/HAM1 family non-canonical purine NTP pyrophosphatase [Chitinophagaceae bacterium]
MATLVFATNNINKVKEVKSLLTDNFNIQTLSEAGINIDIPEPYDTLEENAAEKAQVIYKLTGYDCFAEDTGLEVNILNGEPGVKSARYAGEERSFVNNINKLLAKMENEKDRTASFKSIICLIINGSQILFEGICKGTIIADRRGIMGFGYDPVFVPDGAEKTFAEMSLLEKNNFSHRKKAVEKLIEYLKSLDN